MRQVSSKEILKINQGIKTILDGIFRAGFMAMIMHEKENVREDYFFNSFHNQL